MCPNNARSVTNAYQFKIRKWGIASILLVLVFLSYSNTFHSSWHLDDFHTIVKNSSLHLTDLSLDSLHKTFFSNALNSNKLYRPVPCLTFALNWYFGKDNVVGYHIVNIWIHCTTAIFLYFSALEVLKTPKLRKLYETKACFIAGLAAGLWALNPIQTQAVTYIVQRMASMAAMFYIIGIYAYLKFRHESSLTKQIGFSFVCSISYLMAIGSKENAVIMPFSLILIEIVFFQSMESLKERKKLWIGIGIIVLLIVSISALVLTSMNGDPISFISGGYRHRPFTPLQRLMTQPRVLILYLSQLFYPSPLRLSLTHDVAVSTSLLEPWSTLPGVLFVVSLIGICLFQIRKRPILAFSILFYFLNHCVESSVFSLELVFEHRNYLPSLFLFLPISVGINQILEYYRYRKRYMFQIVMVSLLFLIFGLGTGAYVRNQAWASERILWEDEITKNPQLARPYHNLAWGYYQGKGDYQKAIQLYKKSLRLKQHNSYGIPVTLNNIGRIYYKLGQYEKAIEYFKLAVDEYPQFHAARFQMILAMIKMGECSQALTEVDYLIAKKQNSAAYMNIKGFILLKQQALPQSIRYLQKSLELDPNIADTYLKLGVAYALRGDSEKGKQFLKKANSLLPNDALILLCLAENSLKSGNIRETNSYIDKYIQLKGPEKSIHFLDRLSIDNLAIPLSFQVLRTAIAERKHLNVKNTKKVN